MEQQRRRERGDDDDVNASGELGQGNGGDPMRWRVMPPFGSQEHDCPQAFGTPRYLPVEQTPGISTTYAAVLSMARRGKKGGLWGGGGFNGVSTHRVCVR